jgi:hypothetical protein
MHTTDKRIQDMASSFKAACVDALMDSSLTQQDLADAAGTNQATISRWFAYSTECHMPAFALLALPEPVRLSILRYLADCANCSVTPRPAVKDLNGDVSDEELCIVQEIGELVKRTREGKDKHAAIKCIARIEELTARARVELEAMK